MNAYKMSHQYSTALSHIILLGTGIYSLRCFHTNTNKLILPYGTFAIVIIHSLIGVWRWGNPDHGDKLVKTYRFTQFLQTLFALPCTVGETYSTGGQGSAIGFLYVALSFLVLLEHFIDKYRQELIDIVIGFNILSCILFSYLSDNYFGIVTGVSFSINHFLIEKEGDLFDAIASQDLYNYALCFFTYFSYRAMTV